MVKLESPKYPHLRVHTKTENVKFRDGVAEVSESVAEELLALEDLGLRVADITEEAEADSDDDESDDDTGDGVAEVVKRKPGRPRKTD